MAGRVRRILADAPQTKRKPGPRSKGQPLTSTKARPDAARKTPPWRAGRRRALARVRALKEGCADRRAIPLASFEARASKSRTRAQRAAGMRSHVSHTGKHAHDKATHAEASSIHRAETRRQRPRLGQCAEPLAAVRQRGVPARALLPRQRRRLLQAKLSAAARKACAPGSRASPKRKRRNIRSIRRRSGSTISD